MVFWVLVVVVAFVLVACVVVVDVEDRRGFIVLLSGTSTDTHTHTTRRQEERETVAGKHTHNQRERERERDGGSGQGRLFCSLSRSGWLLRVFAVGSAGRVPLLWCRGFYRHTNQALLIQDSQTLIYRHWLKKQQ